MCGGRKLQTDTQKRDDYSNENINIIHSAEVHTYTYVILLNIKHMC